MESRVESSSCWKATLIVGTLLSYLLAVALNAVLNIPGVSPFNTTIGNQSHKYDTGITPSDATFAIWGLIYLWQLVLVIYCMTLLCRKAAGSPLYIFPGFIPSVFFASYIVNLIGNPGWIFVFLQDMNTLGFWLLLLGVFTLVICLVTSCYQLEQSGNDMVKYGLHADIWCTRIIVQNGVALYLAWVSCATAINGVVVLVYNHGVSMSTACFGALAVINAIIVGWFLLETFFYDRQLRYVFGHYISYVIAFIGVYQARYDADVSYTVYEFVLLMLVLLLTFAKIVIVIVRSIIDPIHYPAKEHEKVKFDKLPTDDILQVKY